MNYSKEHAAYLRAIRTHGWTVGLCRVLVLVLMLGLWELGARLGSGSSPPSGGCGGRGACLSMWA